MSISALFTSMNVTGKLTANSIRARRKSFRMEKRRDVTFVVVKRRRSYTICACSTAFFYTGQQENVKNSISILHSIFFPLFRYVRSTTVWFPATRVYVIIAKEYIQLKAVRSVFEIVCSTIPAQIELHYVQNGTFPVVVTHNSIYVHTFELLLDEIVFFFARDE